MSKYGDEAYAAFMRGCNCSQAVVVPFAPLMGMTEEQALRLAGGFGGGVGRMREVCGAFSGVVMVLGALYGFTDPKDKSAFYAEVQELAHRYAERNGGNSIICRQLLGLEKAEGTPVAEPRTAEYYKKRPCPELARLAADIMTEYIEQHPLPEQGSKS